MKAPTPVISTSTCDRLCGSRRSDGLIDFSEPVKRILPLLGVLLLTTGITNAVLDDTWTSAANISNAIALGLLCSFAAFSMVVRWSESLFTPMVWCLFANCLYYGVGPLAPYLGNTMDMNVSGTRSATDYLIARTNFLNVVGLISVCGGFIISSKLFPKRKVLVRVSSPWTGERGVVRAAWVFLGIGLPVKYLLALPYEFGQRSTLAGSVFSLAQLVPVGVIVLTYLAWRRRGIALGLLLILLLSELVVAILQFSKSAVLYCLIAPLLGAYLATRSVRLFVVGGLLLPVGYYLAGPITNAGRSDILRFRDAQSISDASLSERVAIVRSFFTDVSGVYSPESQAGWWGRLCYAGSQIFAMHQYDSGVPGTSFSMAIYTFVPRMFWKDKPIITDVGLDFTEIISGSRTSSTGIGLYGEAYWNGGWLLVIASGLYLGALLSGMTRFVVPLLRDGEWFFLPLVFLGIRLGMRIDGWFASDYVGGVVIIVAYYAVLRLIFLKASAARG